MANKTTIDVGVVTPVPKDEYSDTVAYERLNIVSFNGSSYMAKKNTTGHLPTDTIYWMLLAKNGKDGEQGPPGDTSPVNVTGSITLNGTTDNTVVMTDIVPELELEVGDVIRIDTGAYNKLHTVESITNNGSIIVNYEHAGNRGNGSLRLPDYTGQATVTRIAKWFNAPIGLGQEWLDVGMAPHVSGAPPDVPVLRTPSTAYQNTTGRSIQINYSIGPGQLVEISNDAVNWFYAVWDNPMAETTTSAIIPNGCWWRATDYNSGAVPGRSVELR